MVFVTSGSRLCPMFSPMARMTSRPVTRSLANLNPPEVPIPLRTDASVGTEAGPEYIRTQLGAGELQGLAPPASYLRFFFLTRKVNSAPKPAYQARFVRKSA